MSHARTSSSRNTQTRWLWERQSLSAGSFSNTPHYSGQMQNPDTDRWQKGSGVFGLPLHITKWALRPLWLSKTNIQFGFRERPGLEVGKRKCHPVWSMYRFTNVISMAGRRGGMKWVEDEKTFLSPISPFLISSQSTSRTRHATNILRWPRRTHTLLSRTHGLSRVNFLTVILFGVHCDEISGHKDSSKATGLDSIRLY